MCANKPKNRCKNHRNKGESDGDCISRMIHEELRSKGEVFETVIIDEVGCCYVP